MNPGLVQASPVLGRRAGCVSQRCETLKLRIHINV